MSARGKPTIPRFKIASSSCAINSVSAPSCGSATLSTVIAPALRHSSGYRGRDLGFGTEEIGQLLALWNDRERSSGDVKALALARASELHHKAKALEAMRRTLERLAATCHGDGRPDCPILNDLEIGDI